MWREFVSWLKRLLLLAQQTERNRLETADLRQRVESLSKVVELLLFDAEQRRREEAHERENLQLRLKVQLLEFERRLPPPAPGGPPPAILEER